MILSLSHFGIFLSNSKLDEKQETSWKKSFLEKKKFGQGLFTKGNSDTNPRKNWN